MSGFKPLPSMGEEEEEEEEEEELPLEQPNPFNFRRPAPPAFANEGIGEEEEEEEEEGEEGAAATGRLGEAFGAFRLSGTSGAGGTADLLSEAARFQRDQAGARQARPALAPLGGMGEEEEDRAAAASESTTRTDGLLSPSVSSRAAGGGAAQQQGSEPYYPDFKRKDPRGRRQRRNRANDAGQAAERQKFSSTATMFFSSTISAPKNNEVIHVVAIHIAKNVQAMETVVDSEFNVFDEKKHPLDKRTPDPFRPSVEVVEQYLLNIFKIGQLAPESLIMMTAYLHRIKEGDKKFDLAPNTWRRTVLIGLVLASKVWEDQAVWNVDFIDLFPFCSPRDMANLEASLLNLLSFDMALDASEYAKTYFDLRAEAELSKDEEFANLSLNKHSIQSLAARSKKFEVRTGLDADNSGRSRSVDFGSSRPLVPDDD